MLFDEEEKSVKLLPSMSRSATPEEAATAVKKAAEKNVTPEIFARMSKVYEREEIRDTIPETVPRGLAQTINDSPETANAMREDLQKLSAVERQWKYINDTVEGAGINREISKIAYNKAMGYGVTDEEAFQLDKYQEEMSELTNAEDYGYNFVESAPGLLIGVGADLLTGIWENRDITLKGAATFGAVGTVAGSPAGVPGMVVGGTGAAITGATLATNYVSIPKDVFVQSVGNVYQALGDTTLGVEGMGDPAEQEMKRRNIAKGAGLLMAAISYAPAGWFASKIPVLKMITRPKAYIKELQKKMGDKTFKRLALDLGTSGLVEGLEEGSQEFVQIMSTSIADTWDGTETSLAEGLQNAATEWRKHTAQIAQAAALGTAGGVVIQGVGKVASKPFEMIAQKTIDSDKEILQDLPEEQFTATTEMVGKSGRLSDTEKDTRSVKAAGALKHLSDETKSTKSKEIIPEKVDEHRGNILKQNGREFIYVDKDELNQWADTPEKAQDVRNLLGDREVEDAGINAPIRFDTVKFLNLVDKYDDVHMLAKVDPDAKSARTAIAEFKAEPKVNPKQEQDQIGKQISDLEVQYRQTMNELETVKDSENPDQMKIRELSVRAEKINAEIGPLIDRSNEIERTASFDQLGKRYEELNFNSKQKLQKRKHDKLSDLAKAESEKITEEFEGILLKHLTDGGEVSAGQKFLDTANLWHNYIGKLEDITRRYGGDPQAPINPNQEIIEALQAESKLRMDQISSLAAEQEAYLKQEAELTGKEAEIGTGTLEAYINNAVVLPGMPLTDFQIQRQKDGLPIYPISPGSLTRELRRLFWDNEINRIKLNKRNVFHASEGYDINQVAAMYGKNPKDFLQILATARTEQESQAAIEELTNKEKDVKFRKVKQINQSRIVQAHNNKTEGHLQAIRDLRDEYDIKYKVPMFDAINRQAQDKIGSTKVRDLDANQWKAGERNSEAKFDKAVETGDIKTALKEKERAALNNQLAKESHIAIGKTNRNFEFLARLNSPTIRAEIRKAGKVYENALNGLMSLYKIGNVGEAKVKLDAYNKFAKKMARQGKGDFRIPPEVLSWLDNTNIEEMTVDQFTYLSDIIRGVVTQAAIDNKMLGTELNEGQTSKEILVQEAHNLAISHPNYKKDKGVKKQGNVSLIDKGGRVLNTGDAGTSNVLYISRELDQYKDNGFFVKQFYKRIMGTGEFDDGENGRKAKVELMIKTLDKWEKVLKKYGARKFKNLGVTTVHVPELADVASLNNGDLTKMDVFMMLMNLGNTENRDRLNNFEGKDPELFMEIAKRVLTVDEFYLAQDIWDMFKVFKPKIADLELKTTGNEIEFVEPKSFKAFGLTFEGGYFPIIYKKDGNMASLIEAQKNLLMAEGSTSGNIFPTAAYEGVVKSNHTKERTGSDWELSLSPNNITVGFDQMIHDLTMRIPVRDAMSLLADPVMAEDIKAIVGHEGYSTIVDTIVEQTNSYTSAGVQLHEGVEKFIHDKIGAINRTFSVQRIAYNVTSMLMSLLTPLAALQKMGGVNFTKHGIAAALKLMNPANLIMIENMQKLAREIDPSLKLGKTSIEEYRDSVMHHSIPKDRLVKTKGHTGKVVNAGLEVYEAALDGGFWVLNTADKISKYMVAIAGYNQFMAGDVDGWPKERLADMTNEQRVKEAMGYAEELSAQITMRNDDFNKAPIQKIRYVRETARYFNEVRTWLNNTKEATWKKPKVNGKLMVEAFRNGDLAEANKHLYGNIGTITGAIAVMMMSSVLMKMLRFQNAFAHPGEEDDDLTFMEDLNRLPGYVMHTLTTADGMGDLLAENTIGRIPVFSSIMFGVETGRSVSFPVTAALEDVSTAFKGIGFVKNEYLYEGEDFMEALEMLEPQEIQAMANSFGYVTGIPFPTNAFAKTIRAIEEDDSLLADVANTTFDAFNQLNNYILNQERQFTDQEVLDMELKLENGEQLTPEEQKLQEAKAYRDALASTGDIGEVLSDDGYEIIKFAESGGKMGARPDKGTAYGPYQFLEGTWRTEVVNTPEGRRLGLIEEDRISRYEKYQEVGMRIFTKRNARKLMREGIPIDIRSIYFAHHFGTKFASQIYGPDADESTVLGRGDGQLLSPRTRKNNPWLDGKNGHPVVRTVGDMRSYIVRALERGIRTRKKVMGDYDNSLALQ